MRDSVLSAITLAVAMLPQPDEELAILLDCEVADLAALRSAPDQAGTLRRQLIASALQAGAERTSAPSAARTLADQVAADATASYRARIEAELLAAAAQGASEEELNQIIAASLARELGPTLALLTTPGEGRR